MNDEKASHRNPLGITRDHIIPSGKGGGNHMGNLVGACFQCNNARGTMEHAVFYRYVRRYGPPTTAILARSKKVFREKVFKARERMESAGMSVHTVNDIMRAKLLAAGLAENIHFKEFMSDYAQGKPQAATDQLSGGSQNPLGGT